MRYQGLKHVAVSISDVVYNVLFRLLSVSTGPICEFVLWCQLSHKGHQ